MSNFTLAAFSDELADRVAASAASIVQVLNTRRPISGVAHGADTVITTARAIGREDGLRVRLPDGETLEADLAGWDPATGLAVLRTRSVMNLPIASIVDAEPRAGHIVLALARSWSNAVTASAGIVAVVGGPLRTGRRRQIARVFRVNASMHEGFAGGGMFGGTAGTTAAGGRERALLVVAVTSASPADTAGVMVGDVLLDVDGHATEVPDDLLDLLTDRRVGQQVTARILRGGAVREVPLTVAERARG
ncbi:MAG: PDZ domain-containing protein [Acidobacteria bacterium]|nr:PDZ domain-containing protein [Acidobacteriota bacterium]